MRTLEELQQASEQASRASNVEELMACVEDLGAMDSADARALCARVRGQLSYLHADYDAAFSHYSAALDLYEQLDDARGVAGALGNIGSTLFFSGKYEEALQSYTKALGMYKRVNDVLAMARMYNNISLIHGETGNLPVALECVHLALSVYQQHEHLYGIALANGNIGMFHNSTGNYPEALLKYRTALDVYDQLGDLGSAAGVVGNIGNIYNTIGEYSTALEYYERAFTLHEQFGNRSGMANVLGNMGNAYLNMGENTNALRAMERSIALCLENGEQATANAIRGNMLLLLLNEEQHDRVRDLVATMQLENVCEPPTLIHIAIAMATLAEREKNIEQSIQYLADALLLAERVGLRKEQADMHVRLRDLCKLTHNFESYVTHNDAYTRIREELHGKDVSVQLAMQEKQREIDANDREVQKQLAVLHSALPKHVADRVARGEVVNDHFENATVMFLDVAGFTTMSAAMTPHEVITMLEELFGICDEAMSTHSMMKIKTIGDSYMAVSFESATNAAHAALDIIRQVSERCSYACRIDLHCGPVVAGVIGKERMQYDVWGDTVNTASRMESSSAPGRVHISQAFAARIEEEYRIQNTEFNQAITESRNEIRVVERGEIEVKGKGKMTTYWLERA